MSHRTCKSRIYLSALLVGAALLAFNTSASAAGSDFVSSRAASSNGVLFSEGLPSFVPSNAVVLKADDPNFKEEHRSRTCAEIYGAPSANVTYAGGPINEVRIELANGQFTGWSGRTGECLRKHEYVRSTTACPSNQNGNLNERRTYTVKDDDSVINDTGWQEVSNTCGFFKVDVGYEPRTMSCPLNQVGVITQRRSFENWSDGTKRNYGLWTETSRSCDFYLVTSSSETQNVSCPTNMTGTIQQQRSFQSWSDGTRRAHSAWSEVSRSCAYYYVSTGYEHTAGVCPAGQYGSTTQERTYQNWSDGSIRAYSAWYQISSSCVTRGSGFHPTLLAKVRGLEIGSEMCPVGGVCEKLSSFASQYFGIYNAMINTRQQSTAGILLNKPTASLSCVSGVSTTYSSGENSSPRHAVWITPLHASFNRGNVSCTISDGGLTATITGNCDSTTGNDADECRSATRTVRVTNVYACTVDTTVGSFNICD